MIRSPLLPLLSLSLLIALAFPPPSAKAASTFDANLDEEEVEFIRLINEYRASNGLGCLSPSPTLNAAADFMSRAMGEQGFFSHEEPPCDESGRKCTGRSAMPRMIDLGHVGAGIYGENIAAGMGDAATAFTGWKNSPPHNANMLNPDYTAIGVARVLVPGAPYAWYWTTDFSNLVDGPWDCTPPFDPIDGPAGKGGGGGCGVGGGGLSALGLLGTLAALTKRRKRRDRA